MSNILVVAALEDELAGAFDDVYVIYTGVGKVNATYALTKAIAESYEIDWEAAYMERKKPKLVINFGTACAGYHFAGKTVSITRFFQGDMDCRGILGPHTHGVTPFEDVPQVIEIPNLSTEPDELPCSTSDTFQTRWEQGSVACDMEAYALAKVCHMEKIPFVCVKGISDSGDPSEWKANCKIFAPRFREIYDELKAQYA